MKKLLFLSLVSAAALLAAPLQSVTFQGLVHLSPEIAQEISGLETGKDLNIELVDSAIKKLYLQNYFEDIWVEEDAGALIVHVKEKPTIAKIDIDGIGENDKETIVSILGVAKGQVYDQGAIDTAKSRIQQFFEAKGYFDTVVEAKSEPLAQEGSLQLTFSVNQGENIIIRSVDLCGANAFDYDDLEPAITNKEREMLGWMWGFNDGNLKIHELATDSGKIREEYLKKGYLDVEVSTPYLRAYMDSFDARIVYQISEGEQYSVAKVAFSIPEGLIDEALLREELTMAEGRVLNVTKLRQDIKIIETKIADLGYAFVRVYPDTKQDKAKKTVDVTYTVIPGEKVTVRHVRISGNSRTIDRVIRREIYLTEGELYSRTDLEDSKGAIKRTGYFEDATIKEERVSKNQVDLVVEVKETNTGTISGGIGYGTSDGIILSASVSDNNVFGSGMKGSINVERDDNELSGRISLTNPRVYDSVYSLGGSIYAEDSEWTDYDEQTYGFNINVGRKFGRYVSASVGYILEQTELSDFNSTFLENSYKDKSLKSSMITSVSFNNTDDYYLPRRGFSASASVEFAGLGGDEKFVTNFYKFSAFYGLRDMTDYDLILRYKARLGFAFDNGYLPINERLYLGGISSLRGYDSKSVSPKNASGDLLGGEMSFNNSVEASFPLIERLKMRGALFFDYGMIGDSGISDEIRASTGIALEWISPLGPISLIFANPLMEEAGDETSSFEFTIGRQF